MRWAVTGAAGRQGGEVAVVGSGPAGLIAALALAHSGAAVTLIGPRPTAAAMAADTRSTALFGASLDLLARTGVVERIGGEATPLAGLRLIDATGGLLRAPEVLFEAAEIGRRAFGANVENRALNGALWSAAAAHGGITCRDGLAHSVEIGPGECVVRTAGGGMVRAKLVVGADGERSMCRAAAGIGARTWAYPQAALALRFAHERDHDGISTELHRRPGPLTTVPLGGRWSSLVWVETPAEADRLAGLEPRAFAQELEAALCGVLGAVGEVGPRARFPLTGLAAEHMGQHRVALVGEAAHRLPPIGAQGLNLAIRDAAWLAEIVGDAVATGGDPGAGSVLDGYERVRRGDVASRTTAVDLLNRSLIADLLPVDLARGAGLVALKTVPWLRQLVMREGMTPAGPLPRLLQPVACGSARA